MRCDLQRRTLKCRVVHPWPPCYHGMRPEAITTTHANINHQESSTRPPISFLCFMSFIHVCLYHHHRYHHPEPIAGHRVGIPSLLHTFSSTTQYPHRPCKLCMTLFIASYSVTSITHCTCCRLQHIHLTYDPASAQSRGAAKPHIRMIV